MRPWRRLSRKAAGLGAGLVLACASLGLAAKSTHAPTPSFELLTHRMDVDVDGAPRAYGPPGRETLDDLRNAHSMGDRSARMVGYIGADAPPHGPVVQGPRDPAPGYYVSQTAFEDDSIENERD